MSDKTENYITATAFIGNGTKETPQRGATKCMYMDSMVDGNRRVFTQWQWKTIQESVKGFFSR